MLQNLIHPSLAILQKETWAMQKEKKERYERKERKEKKEMRKKRKTKEEIVMFSNK